MMNIVCRMAVISAFILSTTACGTGGGEASVAKLPEGETDISCAGLIYAAKRLVDEGKITDEDGTISSNSMSAITRYGTAHANAKGLDSTDAFAVIKLQAYRFTGETGSSDSLSSSTIATRAKACITG